MVHASFRNSKYLSISLIIQISDNIWTDFHIFVIFYFKLLYTFFTLCYNRWSNYKYIYHISCFSLLSGGDDLTVIFLLLPIKPRKVN